MCLSGVWLWAPNFSVEFANTIYGMPPLSCYIDQNSGLEVIVVHDEATELIPDENIVYQGTDVDAASECYSKLMLFYNLRSS